MNLTNNDKTPLFLKLFVDSQKAIYSYVFTMVYDHDLADDILQDTVAMMWERFSTYQEGTNFAAWGVTIARYKLLEYFNRNRHQHTTISEELLEKISQTAQRRLENIDERVTALENCLDKLNSQDRDLIKIRYEKEMKVKDIAVKINRPIQGLYQAMSRIHHTLLHCIELTLRRWEHDV